MRPSANKPILITLVLFILFVACLCKPIKNELKTLPGSTLVTYQDLTEDQKTAFNQCIESFPSDYVCDSCLTLIVNK